MARKTVDNDIGTETAATKSDLEFSELSFDVQRAYEEGVTIDAAERLAAKFLGVQLQVAEELSRIDLDTRMKKNGLKAIKSAVYMKAAHPADGKKPAEGYLDNVVTLDENVCGAQDRYDTSDARKESLMIYLGIFKDAHIYFRGVAKGRFE